MKSLILQTATRLLLPLLVLYSMFVLFEGHHRPGGGFIGGLLLAAAIGLCALAFDVPTARRILPLSPVRLIGVGLLTAAGSGTASLVYGEAFLTGHWLLLDAPAWGALDLGTPFLFDFGVYLAVIGVITMILLTLAEE